MAEGTGDILGAPQSALEDDINVDLTSLTGKGDSYRPDPAGDAEVSESSLTTRHMQVFMIAASLDHGWSLNRLPDVD